MALFLWQWASKDSLVSQLQQLQNYNSQLSLLSGVGPLKSTHLHADVKVYINGKAVDFSQSKYQLTTSFIHFEERVGDVIHIHATGLTVGHMMKSVGMDMNNNCILFEKNNYCNEDSKKLRFYVNGRLKNDFDNYIIKDLDKILISYGTESDVELQKQLDSITNLAAKSSIQK